VARDPLVCTYECCVYSSVHKKTAETFVPFKCIIGDDDNEDDNSFERSHS
jgi:hypothetical protein